jgi:hypothetical protein
MRTTIRLSEELLKEAKRQAAESGTTLTAIIEDSLRERLYRGKERARSRKRVRLKTAGSGGVQPGIDLDDSAALLDAMEGGK